jgi:hypothetical protein
MTKRPATHKNAVVVGGSGDNEGFAGPGSVGNSDLTVLGTAERNADGLPLTAEEGGPGSFSGAGPQESYVSNTSRDPVTGHNTDPKNR